MGLPEPNADWRIRADAGTRAFAIEHRQAGRWITLAAFSVALAPCSAEP
jgi:hypothetical protein